MSGPLSFFIKRHRDIYNVARLRDLSPEQRLEALLSALAEWSGVWPRSDQKGKLRFPQGKTFALLEADFLSTTYQRLFNAAVAKQPSSSPGIIQPTIYNIQNGSNYNRSFNAGFSSPMMATMFPPGYDDSYNEFEIPTSSDDRGRKILQYQTANGSDAEIDILYDAMHRIEDDGSAIDVASVASEGDTISVDGTAYEFAADPTSSQIPIGEDRYSQTQEIADFFLYNEIAFAKAHYYTVKLAPTLPDSSITVSVSSSSLSASKYKGVNTLEMKDERHVFRLMLSNLMLCKALDAAESGEVAQSGRGGGKANFYKDFAFEQRQLVKPYLFVAG